MCVHTLIISVNALVNIQCHIYEYIQCHISVIYMNTIHEYALYMNSITVIYIHCHIYECVHCHMAALSCI